MLYYLPAWARASRWWPPTPGPPYPPAWWLNLQAQPDAMVDVPGRSVAVHARPAAADERAVLWRRFVERLADYERYAESAEREIPIVILEPIDEGGRCLSCASTR